MALRVYWNHSCTIVDNQTFSEQHKVDKRGFPNSTRSTSVAFRIARNQKANLSDNTRSTSMDFRASRGRQAWLSEQHIVEKPDFLP